MWGTKCEGGLWWNRVRATTCKVGWGKRDEEWFARAYLYFEGQVRRGVKKSEYFTVRLTVSIYPSPPYGHLFVIFLGVFFILVYDSMCSEADFTQEKVDFHATTEIPNSSSYCCCPLDDNLQVSGPSGSSFAKGRPLRITICRRPVPSDHCLQEAGPSF